MKNAIKKILAYIIRMVYLIVGLTFYYMENAANWFVGLNRKTEYIRKGSCKKCGKCCELLAIQYPNFFNRSPWLLRTTIKWHEFHLNFTHLGTENNYFLYKCNFPKPDRTCGIYHTRPRLCREYPKVRLYGRPHSHINCGYYFIRRDGQPTFDEALHHAYDKSSSSNSPPLTGGD